VGFFENYKFDVDSYSRKFLAANDFDDPPCRALVVGEQLPKLKLKMPSVHVLASKTIGKAGNIGQTLWTPPAPTMIH